MSEAGTLSWREIQQNAGQLRQSLTASQRMLLDVLLAKESMSAFMTAEELGASVGVSEATVIRFSQSIGFDSFISLKRSLWAEMRQHSSPSTRLEKLSVPDSFEGLVEHALQADRSSLADLAGHLETSLLQRAVELITGAGVVHVVGSRSSYSLAHMTVYLLDHIMPNVRLVNIDVGPNASIHHGTPDDVVIAFSYPRYSKLAVRTAGAFSHVGAKVIAVTDSYSAPITEFSEVTLIAPCPSESFFNSAVGATALINLLVTLVAQEKSVDSVARLKKREKAMAEVNMFLQ